MFRWIKRGALVSMMLVLLCCFCAAAQEEIPYRALKDRLTYDYITVANPVEFEATLSFNVIVNDNECADIIVCSKGRMELTKGCDYSFTIPPSRRSVQTTWYGVKVERGNRVEISYTPVTRDGALPKDVLVITCLDDEGNSLQTCCLLIEQVKDQLYAITALSV